VVVVAVAEAAVEEEANEEVPKVVTRLPNDQRRRISSTLTGSWTSKCASSSTAVAKVRKLSISIVGDKLIISTVIGTLKGFDQLMNVVLDDVKEVMRGMSKHAIALE
jgi:small nuclear ribonucleoprotein (snRNP)-like protein